MFDEDLQEADQSISPAPAFNLRNTLCALRERWWLILLCVVIAGGVTTLYLRRAPTIFAATAVIRFETETPKILNVEGVMEEDMRSEEARKEKLKEIQLVLKSRPLLTRVIETNNLAANEQFVSLTQTNQPGTNLMVAVLSKMVHVELRPGTTFIDVTVEHTDPKLTAQLANSLVKELILLNSESYKSASRFATSFLAEEAQELQHKLTECETKLQAYKDQSLSLEQRQAVVADNLKELNQKVNEAKAERIRLDSEYIPVRDLANNVQELLNVPRIANDPTVAGIRASLAQQEVDFANVRQIYKAKHPTYTQAQSRLSELRQALTNATMKATQTMRVSCENVLDREKALLKELEKQEKGAQDLNTQFIPYNTLLRDIEQYRALYDSIIKRMGETAIAGNMDKRPIQVFQEAQPPTSSIKPRRRFITVGGLLAGLAVGLLLALGLEWLDDSLKTLNDAEQYLKLPVLSTIPKIRAIRSKDRQIVMGDDHPFSGAESFRSLRTSMFLIDQQDSHRSFLFTSTLAGEGKTFCSVNYAVSLAQQGLRTLLVDADLRRPMLEGLILGSRKNGSGLTDYLLGQQITIHETKIENLFFISAGSAVPNPAELLARCGLKDLLDEATNQFDRIVVDSAPIFGVSDTLRLIKDVHAVCLVVLAGRTPRTLAMRTVQTLLRAGAPLAGIILNAVPHSRRASYDNPYHDYGYYLTSSRKAAPRAQSASVSLSPPEPQRSPRSARG